MSLHRASITGSCGIIWRGARSECPGKQEVSALTSKCGSVWVDVLVPSVTTADVLDDCVVRV